MKTTVTNFFTGFKKTIRHSGTVPAVTTLRRAIRESKAIDCRSQTTAIRDDGAILEIMDGAVRIVDYVRP